MVKRPLWELAKKSMEPIQNARQISSFLEANQVKPIHKKLVNPSQFYIRLSVMLLMLQLEIVESSLWFFLYFFVKSFYLFKLESKKNDLRDISFLFLVYLAFPKILNLLPISNLVYWSIGALYFFDGVSERYLILQVLLINSFSFVNFSILVQVYFIRRALGLTKIKKKIKRSKMLLAADIITFTYFERYKYAFFVSLILVCLHTICLFDQKLVHQKKRYSHLFEIAEVQQFH